ncbi:hypothetical protein pb186bvf_010805 [Paramecium bursaria]
MKKNMQKLKNFILTHPIILMVDRFHVKLIFNIEQYAKEDNVKQLQLPFYPGIIQMPPKQNEIEYLVTGGVLIGENDLQTTGYSFRYQLLNKMEDIRVQVICRKEGPIVEVDGEEVAQEVDVVPPMPTPRHNHKLFKLRKPGTENQYLYLAVGGQYISANESYITNQCEILDELYQIDEDSYESRWTSVAQLNIGRAGYSGFELNDNIYVFGGYSLDADGKPVYLNPSQSEVYNYQQNKWTPLKLKWKLGLNAQNLGSFCFPIDNDNILIFGGSSSQGPTDQINLLKIKQGQVEPIKNTKLSKPRSGALGLFLQNQKISKVTREQNYERLENEFVDLIIILGGAQDEISFDIFIIRRQPQFSIEFMKKEKLNDLFQSDILNTFQFYGHKEEDAWVKAMIASPVLLFQTK